MFRSLIKILIALSFSVMALSTSQAAMVEHQDPALEQANLIAEIETAYMMGELNGQEAQYLIMMATQQGATAAEIWQWIKNAYGEVSGTVTLGYRCLKAWGGRKWCKMWASTDEARTACEVKYFPSILNNCIAQQ